MMTKWLRLFIVLVMVCVKLAFCRHQLVAYWGQNGVSNRKNEYEKEWSLQHFCRESMFDIINIAFMNVFFDEENKDSFPRLNFAFHCTKSHSNEYPNLLHCPNIETGIELCHLYNKRVLLSLGGAVGDYGFESVQHARLLAYRVWNLFLGGKNLKHLRPFRSAILDGIDLNIAIGSHLYYTDFIIELRRLERVEGDGRKYIIAGAPSCRFPDGILGPDISKLLGDVPTLVDYLFVHYRSDTCNTKNHKNFFHSIRTWLKFSTIHDGPVVYVGLPADVGAHSGDDSIFRSPSELAFLYKKIKKAKKFGGFVLWDASFDQNNLFEGKMFSGHIIDMMNKQKQIDDHSSYTKPTPKPKESSTKMPIVKPTSTSQSKGSERAGSNTVGEKTTQSNTDNEPKQSVNKREAVSLLTILADLKEKEVVEEAELIIEKEETKTHDEKQTTAVNSNTTLTDSDNTVTDDFKSVTDSDKTVIDMEKTVTDSDKSIADSDENITDYDTTVADSDRTRMDSDKTATDGNSVTDKTVTDSDKTVTNSVETVTDSDKTTVDNDKTTPDAEGKDEDTLYDLRFEAELQAAYLPPAEDIRYCNDTAKTCADLAKKGLCTSGAYISIMARKCGGTCKLCYHGDYTPWGEWSECSKTCGGGTRSRYRTCTNPVPTEGGLTCQQQNLGEPENTEICNKEKCMPACFYTKYGCCPGSEQPAKGLRGYGCRGCKDVFFYCRYFDRLCHSKTIWFRGLFIEEWCGGTCQQCPHEYYKVQNEVKGKFKSRKHMAKWMAHIYKKSFSHP